MKRVYLIGSLLLLTSYLVAQDADHLLFYKTRNYILKNYTFKNIKELESKVGASESNSKDDSFVFVRATYDHFLKDFQENELLQQFKKVLHSDDLQQAFSARQTLVTIQSDLFHRQEQLERHHYVLNKQLRGYIEKIALSGGGALFFNFVGWSFGSSGLAISGTCLGVAGMIGYGFVLTKMMQRPLLYEICCQELEKISAYLDDIAYGQDGLKEASGATG